MCNEPQVFCCADRYNFTFSHLEECPAAIFVVARRRDMSPWQLTTWSNHVVYRSSLVGGIVYLSKSRDSSDYLKLCCWCPLLGVVGNKIKTFSNSFFLFKFAFFSNGCRIVSKWYWGLMFLQTNFPILGNTYSDTGQTGGRSVLIRELLIKGVIIFSIANLKPQVTKNGWWLQPNLKLHFELYACNSW